jgi:hypothetical protein
MQKLWLSVGGLALVLTAVLVTGCRTKDAPISGQPDEATHPHEHAHSDEGPHGGHLIELGDEAYHAEWLHDEQSGKITVILLDGAAKEEVPIAADHVIINVAIEGQAPKQYQLAAVNPSGDDPPQASRFEATEPVLMTALRVGEGVQASLSVDIGGKQYVGLIEHHAADDGHGHKH